MPILKNVHLHLEEVCFQKKFKKFPGAQSFHGDSKAPPPSLPLLWIVQLFSETGIHFCTEAFLRN